MSLWIETLRAAVFGEHEQVRQMLGVELPQQLRWPASASRQDVTVYAGPSAKAVLNFIRSLSDEDAQMATSRADEFIEFLTDQVVSKIKRTVRLAAFCAEHPEMGIAEVATLFDGWGGLKRSFEEKQVWIKQHLASMKQLGILDTIDGKAFEDASQSSLEHPLGFDERALIKMWSVGQSWIAFKEVMEISAEFYQIDNDSDGISAEAVEYSMALKADSFYDGEIPAEQQAIEFREVAAEIRRKLEEELDYLNSKKPRHGYRPIAWHNAWWYFTDKYPVLNLTLHLVDPCCDTDQTLADHINRVYPSEYTGINRLSVLRRRTRLTEACDGEVIGIVMALVRKN